MTDAVPARLDDETCYRALQARDPRFDGLFFVAVSTTGVYCRPICPARTPRRERCAFFASGALAEREGFRACLRCRPELAPGARAESGVPVGSRARLAARAIARIPEVASSGAAERGRSLEALALELGVTSRHLRRAIEAELGVSPIELVTSRRLAMAKQLLHDTRLGLAEIALASGFRSVRRFNDAFRARFGRAPSSLRRDAIRGGEAPGSEREPRAIALRLGYRAPLAWDAMLAFVAARAVPGVERVVGSVYERTVSAGGRAGLVRVRDDAARSVLIAEIPIELAGAAMSIAARLRALFDLDAEPMRIAEALGRDRRLARAVARRPGLRVPGAWDGLEIAVRAVLGQQVSVRAATTLAARLAARFGELLADGTRLAPTAGALARAREDDLRAIGLTGARARTLIALGRAVEDGVVVVERGASPEATIAALERVPGIGEWTAQYVAMRALAWPDALPSGDLVLRRALGLEGAAAVRRRAERWRPWRAYGAMHLWAEAADAARPRRAGSTDRGRSGGGGGRR